MAWRGLAVVTAVFIAVSAPLASTETPRPSHEAVYPRAHTCFNRIDVPLYRTKEELVAGFEFVLELGDQTFTMD